MNVNSSKGIGSFQDISPSSSETILENSKSVISLWRRSNLSLQKNTNNYTLRVTPLTRVSQHIQDKNITEECELDESAKLFGQPSGIGFIGTGFLAKVPNTDQERVFMAGHNIYGREAEDICCVFGYTLDKCEKEEITLPRENVYFIKTRKEHYIPGKIVDEDWAILELDRKVELPWKPAILSTDYLHYKYRPLSLYGFPEGTPLKVTLARYKGPERYKERNTGRRKDFLIADTISYTGHSGGPIYDNITNTVIGILRSGSRNYTKNTSGRYVDIITEAHIIVRCTSIAYILQHIEKLDLLPGNFPYKHSDQILQLNLSNLFDGSLFPPIFSANPLHHNPEAFFEDKKHLENKLISFGLHNHYVPYDNNSLFTSLADQIDNGEYLLFKGFKENTDYLSRSLLIRNELATWLENNASWSADNKVTLCQLTMGALASDSLWRSYCSRLRFNNIQGDSLALFAASQLYNCSIILFTPHHNQPIAQLDPIFLVEDTRAKHFNSDPILLSYYSSQNTFDSIRRIKHPDSSVSPSASKCIILFENSTPKYQIIPQPESYEELNKYLKNIVGIDQPFCIIKQEKMTNSEVLIDANNFDQISCNDILKIRLSRQKTRLFISIPNVDLIDIYLDQLTFSSLCDRIKLIFNEHKIISDRFSILNIRTTARKVEVNAGFAGIDNSENLVEGTQKMFTPQLYEQLCVRDIRILNRNIEKVKSDDILLVKPKIQLLFQIEGEKDFFELFLDVDVDEPINELKKNIERVCKEAEIQIPTKWTLMHFDRSLNKDIRIISSNIKKLRNKDEIKLIFSEAAFKKLQS